MINGALSASQAFQWGFVCYPYYINITSEKNESSHQLWVFNGTLMGLCLLAKFFNGALSSSLLHHITTEK